MVFICTKREQGFQVWSDSSVRSLWPDSTTAPNQQWVLRRLRAEGGIKERGYSEPVGPAEIPMGWPTSLREGEGRKERLDG